MEPVEPCQFALELQVGFKQFPGVKLISIFLQAASISRPRLLPEKEFPPYAYLPGRHPHPVRDPAGHSHEPNPGADEAVPGLDMFRWGIDLFNHGYYWEAHEAWEPLWHAAKHDAQRRRFFKGLILLAAAGVKLREGKQIAAARHAARAAVHLRQIPREPGQRFQLWIGVSPAQLATKAEAATASSAHSHASISARPEPVFGFVLLPMNTSIDLRFRP